MKKILALFLALCMVFAAAGCSGELADSALDFVADSVYQDEFDTLVDEDNPPAGFYGDSSDTSNSYEESDPFYTDGTSEESTGPIDEDGWYYSADDVSLYLYTYGCLPDNYITKDEAEDLGWTGGSVEQYAPGYAIGGDIFYNREGRLPKDQGRVYYECDIDTDGYHSRGARRIVFSNDGLIYYTENHYGSFILLYGEE